MLWVLWVIIVSGANLTEGFLKRNDVPIGVFYDADSTIGETINSTFSRLESKNRNITLVPYVLQTNVSNALFYRNDLCSKLGIGVFAVLGSENSNTAKSIVSTTETLQMPYITYSDQDVRDMDRDKMYKLRMAPSYIEAIVELIKFYRWTTLHYLYNDDAGLRRYERLSNLLVDDNVEIDLRFIDPLLPNHYKQLRSLDKKRAHTDNWDHILKILILDLTSDTQVQNILNQLVDVGMTRDNYHVITTTLSMRNLNLTRLKYGGMIITGFQLSGVRSVSPVNELVSDAIEVIYKAMNSMHTEYSQSFYYVNNEMYNGRMRGVPCHSYENPFMQGRRVIQYMKKVLFYGATGKVQFDTQGYRRNYSLDILQQTMGSDLQKVSTWNASYGLVPGNISIGYQPEKRDDGFYNETIIITTVKGDPYCMEKNVPSLTGNDRYEGYSIDLAEELAKLVHFKYIIKPVADGKHGTMTINSTWNGMIGELIAKRADMAIADLSITSDRERVVDFSTPFMSLGISVMIRVPEKQKPGVFSFMEPLSYQIWMLIALSFIGVSVTMFIVSRLSPYEWNIEEDSRGEEKASNDFTLQNSAWFATGALMCQGSDLSPVSPSGRLVGTAWWFFTLIIISSYTANLAAFLTVETINIPIENAEDLARQDSIKYGTLDSGTTRRFFENSSVPLFQEMWKKMINVPTTREGIAKVRSSKGTYAFFVESVTNEYANQRKPCDTMKVGQNLDSKSFGVATPIGHKLRHKITYAILRLHETGVLNKLKQRWWYDKGQCSSEKPSAIRALTLSNVTGVFYILIGGLLIAMCGALLEFVFRSVSDAKKYKKTIRQSMRSKARLSIAGESDDSPYSFLPRPALNVMISPPSDGS